MTPLRVSRKAIEKIPLESLPCRIGVSNTCQVSPRSPEWNTRATLPPVANQIFGSIRELSFESDEPGPAPGVICHRALGRMAIQLFDAAKAPSPSLASGNCEGGIGFHVFPSSVSKTSNFSLPVSSGIGSPTTIPCFESQNAIESKNPLGLVLVN